jgi:hypothetical protein
MEQKAGLGRASERRKIISDSVTAMCLCCSSKRVSSVTQKSAIFLARLPSSPVFCLAATRGPSPQCNPLNKAHTEGAFGLFSQEVPPLALDTLRDTSPMPPA